MASLNSIFKDRIIISPFDIFRIFFLIIITVLVTVYYYDKDYKEKRRMVVVNSLQAVQQQIEVLGAIRRHKQQANALYNDAKWLIGKNIKFMTDISAYFDDPKSTEFNDLKKLKEEFCSSFGEIKLADFIDEEQGKEMNLSMSSLEDEVRRLLFIYSKVDVDWTGIGISVFLIAISVMSFLGPIRGNKTNKSPNKANAADAKSRAAD